MSLNPEFADAVDRAGMAAGSGNRPGWNTRFRAACRKEKIEMMSLGEMPVGIQVDEWMMAPQPMPGPDGWTPVTCLVYRPAVQGRTLAAAIARTKP